MNQENSLKKERDNKVEEEAKSKSRESCEL